MNRTRTLSALRRQRRSITHRVRHRQPQGGFTLVEMLVAVTLVLIMMTMFAEIFQIAGGSIAKTRGLAENDQRSRTLQTIIKADLDKRSYRWVYPFAAGEEAAAPESNIGNRQGYFYISENNAYNSLDDVLQLTVVSTITSKNKDQLPYYGKALNLGSFTYPNQPDADDGQLSANNTGSSTVAEVAYFVRNGNLYRRQLLIREPLTMAGSNPQPDDSIPVTRPTGIPAFDPTNATLSAIQYTNNQFWNDFDYSAYYNEQPAGTSKGANFLGTDALSNSGLVSFGAIAAPFRRFGHHHRGLGVTAGHEGRPKEFSANSAAAEFLGRFTLEECSHVNFRYPQNMSNVSGGIIPTTPTQVLNVVNPLDPNDKTIDDFRSGPRRGEDLLLSNVHAFDILVWDDNYGGFVNIGDQNLPVTSDYAMVKRRNTSYGPRLPATVSAPSVVNAVFDTWHPQIPIDYDGDGTTPEPPPFRPITFRPDYVPYTGFPEPTPPPNAGGQSDWQPDTAYLIGQIVFPTAGNLPQGYSTPFYYRCVDNSKSVKPTKKKGKGKGAGNAARSGPNPEDEPVWPREAGLIVEDNALAWQAVDNRKPLKAIKLEIRFVDASTQQQRQLTIVHSLVD